MGGCVSARWIGYDPAMSMPGCAGPCSATVPINIANGGDLSKLYTHHMAAMVEQMGARKRTDRD